MSRKVHPVYAHNSREVIAWKVDVSAPGEKLKWERFKLDNKAGAEARLAEVLTGLFAAKITPAPKSVVGSITKALTMEQGRALFVNGVVANLTVNTQLSYRNLFNRFARVYADNLPIEGITVAVVSQLLSLETQKGEKKIKLRRKSALKYLGHTMRYLRHLKQNYNAKIDKDVLEYDFSAGSYQKKKPKGFLTDAQYEAIIQATKDHKLFPETYIIWRICGTYGLRIEECLQLTQDDLDPVTRKLKLIRKGTEEEGPKEIVITLTEKVVKTIFDISDKLYKRHKLKRSHDSQLFIEERTGVPLTYTTVCKRWQVVCAKVGVDPHTCTIHSLRRYACGWLYKALNYNEQAVKSICSWDSDAIKFYYPNMSQQLNTIESEINANF